MIIGRPSIKRYNLKDKLCSQFSDGVRLEQKSCGVNVRTNSTTHTVATLSSNTDGSYIRKSKGELLDCTPDTDGLYADDVLNVPWDLPESQVKDDEDLMPEIFGDESLQRDIRTLCEEYKDIFSTSLRPEPALLPPMELQVDTDKRKDRANSRPSCKIAD